MPTLCVAVSRLAAKPRDFAYLTCHVGRRALIRCAPQQSCGTSRCGSFHEIVRQPVRKRHLTNPSENDRIKSKQAHNLAHPSGCNIVIKYFDLLLTNT